MNQPCLSLRDERAVLDDPTSSIGDRQAHLRGRHRRLDDSTAALEDNPPSIGDEHRPMARDLGRSEDIFGSCRFLSRMSLGPELFLSRATEGGARCSASGRSFCQEKEGRHDHNESCNHASS
jgi:hypothetical protein